MEFRNTIYLNNVLPKKVAILSQNPQTRTISQHVFYAFGHYEGYLGIPNMKVIYFSEVLYSYGNQKYNLLEQCFAKK